MLRLTHTFSNFFLSVRFFSLFFCRSRPTSGGRSACRDAAMATGVGETDNLTTLENLNEETLLAELKVSVCAHMA